MEGYRFENFTPGIQNDCYIFGTVCSPACVNFALR